MNSFDILIALLATGACLGAMFLGGYTLGRKKGWDDAKSIWERSALVKSAIWKDAYIRLWNSTYRPQRCSVWLTDEEREALKP